MRNNNEKSLGKVKVKALKDAIKSIERDFKGQPINIDEIDITFEYIVGSFFPQVMDNINKTIKDERSKAYIEGYNAGKVESGN